MANTHYNTDGKLGINLSTVGSTAKHKLLERTSGNNESEWVYVYASASITQYMAVGVEASGTASPLDVTGARRGDTIGIAQVAFSAADYGWVATKGRSLRVATTAAVAVGVRLYTAASTPGRVDDAAVSTQAQIGGLYLIATASGTTASSAACVAGNLISLDAAFII
jgi:hypothetical protein